MDSNKLISQQKAKELLDASDLICLNNMIYLNSMALKCAVHLGIPDAIYKHGNPMTLNELATSLNINPTKVTCLLRLMRLLCHNNFFSTQTLPDGEVGYALTPNSELLLKDHPFSQVPIYLAFADQVMTTDPAHSLDIWFRSEIETPFQVAHGRSLWEHASHTPGFNISFNESMASDTKIIASMLLAHDEVGGIFEGVTSLVDVGGGIGTMAKALAEAYPDMECVVLDLPHVLHGLQGNGCNLTYVVGDMFKEIPQTQAVLLKTVLHDWSDDQCLKILERCKEAIPTKDKGGKVIIIDMVMDEKNNAENLNLQLLFDLQIMSLTPGGMQRSEEEFKKLFINAGFDEYKIYHVLGSRSLIEVCYS